MKILIQNVTLISMDEEKEKIQKNIDILIENEIIKKIGHNLLYMDEINNKCVEKCEKNENIKIIDGTNKVVIPGLINTHSHVPMSIFRETIDGYNLQDWLTKKIWPMEDKLTEEDIYVASLLSFVEMIETGCTTINDMYFKTDEIIKAMKKTGIRLQTTRTLMNMSTEEEGQLRLEELFTLINKYKNETRLTFNAGIHGLYTTNEPYIKKCIKFAKENNLRVHMHFCENSKEVEDIKEIYNKIPSEVLVDNFKEIPTLLAHSVKLTANDIIKMKNMNISVSHCPISNLKLGCGIAPIKEMLEAGINVSLGTDGQGSGCSLDLFETMKITALLQKGILENANVINSYEVLKMATINGAKALGLDELIGSIKEGKQADIVILNLEETILKPQNDIISQIVYNANGKNAETTIVAGDILMENRELKIDIDKRKLFEKCEDIIKRIS